MICRDDSKNLKVVVGNDKKTDLLGQLYLYFLVLLVQGWQWEYRTDYLKGLFSTSSFLFMKKVVQFYITEIEPNFNIDAVLTKTQQELYGLTECVEY